MTLARLNRHSLPLHLWPILDLSKTISITSHRLTESLSYLSHLPTLPNPNINNRPFLPYPHILNLPYHTHPFLIHNLSKHHMLPIQMRRRRTRDEELAPVRVRAGIRHRQQTGLGVREEGTFVGEGAGVVDAGCACAEEGGGCGVQDVAGLEHEGLDLKGLLVGGE